MSKWLGPIERKPADLPSGKIRSVGRFDPIAYQRAYYHNVVKPSGQRKTAAYRKKSAAYYKAYYHRNIERMRALGRARYWKNRDKYAAAARERWRRKRAA